MNTLPEVNLPHPSESYEDIRVFFSVSMNQRLIDAGKQDLVFRYTNFKMDKQAIAENAHKVVLVVRTGLLRDLQRIQRTTGAFTNGTFIYSQWECYRSEPKTLELLKFAEDAGMSQQSLHTSGHATTKTLKRVVDGLQPQRLIPIHTFHPEKYTNLSKKVVRIGDNEVLQI